LKGIGNNYGYDSGMDNFDIKFVATKFHGQGENQLIVVHIVAGGLVIDNANLMCQLLANSLGHYMDMHTAPGAQRALPPNVRLQVDGVATNWGLITFCFISYLVLAGFVHAFDMCRNPVGEQCNCQMNICREILPSELIFNLWPFSFAYQVTPTRTLTLCLALSGGFSWANRGVTWLSSKNSFEIR
jgi:hypothetical protein